MDSIHESSDSDFLVIDKSQKEKEQRNLGKQTWDKHCVGEATKYLHPVSEP